jgi:site-specific recombinase XerD
MERRIAMRQVIRRFLKHLDAEKNASVTTIESYKYDLHKFDVYLVKRLGNRFLPGDVTHFVALQRQRSEHSPVG